MTPQRRTALVSIGAAAALAVLKLGAGIVSGSLGLVSEALHSGTDLVAAILTFFAIGVAGRPADEGHQYGHGKAEHLAALAEAAVLALVSVAVAAFAVGRLTGAADQALDPAWWVFLVIGVVLAIDLSRTVVSARTARRYQSEALRSNALHFGSDFAGTLAVLGGLIAASIGYPAGRLDRRALRRRARARRRLPPDPPQRRRADGPGARGRGGGRARGDLADRAAGRARRASGCATRRAGCSRTSSSPSRPAPQSARATRRLMRSRRRSSARCPGATSSSTWSRAGRRRRCASAHTPRP